MVWKGLTGAAAAVGIVLGALASAAAPAQAWTGSLPRVYDTHATFRAASVWVYGDSITAADYPEMKKRFAAQGLRSAVDAQPGIPTEPAIDRLEQRITYLRMAPKVLVVALGTNDTDDPSVMPAQMTRVAQLMPSSTTVVWVNVWKCRWRLSSSYQARDRAGTSVVNEEIATFVAAHPNFRVADWWTALNRSNPRVYLGDGVHTIASSGRPARNSLIVRTVVQPTLVGRPAGHVWRG
ncbi:MAG: hypothetical protein IE926_10705 [Micrococcales bacterium]|nr:hypothetical protein [Micrococcales bacterium]